MHRSLHPRAGVALRGWSATCQAFTIAAHGIRGPPIHRVCEPLDLRAQFAPEPSLFQARLGGFSCTPRIRARSRGKQPTRKPRRCAEKVARFLLRTAVPPTELACRAPPADQKSSG